MYYLSFTIHIYDLNKLKARGAYIREIGRCFVSKVYNLNNAPKKVNYELLIQRDLYILYSAV